MSGFQEPNNVVNQIETHATAAGLKALVDTQLAAIRALDNWNIISIQYWSDATNFNCAIVYAYYTSA